MGNVRTRRLVALGMAGAVAAVDLGQKLAVPADFHHGRSAGAIAFMGALAVGVLTVAPRLESAAVALGAGVAAGGAVATALSGLFWAGVPDPLVVRSVSGGIAFNLADVFVLVGVAVLVCSAVVHGLRNRERLRHPV